MNREVLSRSFGGVLLAAGLLLAAAGIWAAVIENNWRFALAGLFGLGIITTGWQRLFPGEPPPLAVAPDDPLMRSATEQARRDLRRFVQGSKEGAREPFAKYPLKTDDGATDHVWGNVHAISGSTLTVSLVSEPVGAVHMDSTRQALRLGEIEDWMLVDVDGRIEGGYTQLAMAKIYKRDKGYVPYSIRSGLSGFLAFDAKNLQ
jgi:uncharacterized protein YegJ (DUF2314 family)